MSIDTEIYPGGFYSLIGAVEKRQRSFRNAVECLPDDDVDLCALLTQIIPPTPAQTDALDRTCYKSKEAELRPEFVGQSELHLLHALLISVLRRDDPPPRAQLLFHRLWLETGTEFIAQIPVRWMVSATTTFADCGLTGDQRACGMGLSILFDLMKLHDSERRLSACPGDQPFTRQPRYRRITLAFDMDPYSLKTGGLDRNMLARLWKLCEADSTIAPLGFHMLRLVMHDKRSIFGRVQQFKPVKSGKGKTKKKPQPDPTSKPEKR